MPMAGREGSGCASLVAMIKPTNSRNLDDHALIG